MPTRAEIVAEARTWKGTPWQHQGRLKGVAADCVGVVVKTGEAVGLVSAAWANRTDYGRHPQPLKMKAGLEQVFDRVPREDMKAGDILWLRIGDNAQHLGILTADGTRPTLLHAVNYRAFEELPMELGAMTRVVAVYRFRGITE